MIEALKMNKVSVIIALYNHAALVTEAVESVLAQTYKDVDIIVVDDGSTDNPKEILNPYIEQGQIRYIHQNNQGLSAARNTGIKAAQGKYIKFLDSDDFLYPEQIEKQVEDIKNDERTLSVTDNYDLRPTGEMIRRDVQMERDDQPLASFIVVNRAVVHSFLTPRTLIEEVGGFDETLTACEDWDLWIRILRTGAAIKHTPSVGCCYRISTASMSADMTKMFRQECKVIEKVNSWLMGKHDLSEYMQDCILRANVRLMEEGMARRERLDLILSNAFRMTDELFRRRKKKISRFLYILLGVKRYTWIRYVVRKVQQPSYEYELLHGTNIYRYGDRSCPQKDAPFIARLTDVPARMDHKGIILMYHRVTDQEFDPWELSVTQTNFEDHMKVLRKYGRPVHAREMVRDLKRFRIGKKEIVVTFDDGYADNFHNAKPILERYGIPATFFILSEAVGSDKEFWWDELQRVIITPPNLPSSFQMVISGAKYYWQIGAQKNIEIQDVPPNGIPISKTQLYYALWKILRPVPVQEKGHYLKQIEIWTNYKTQPRVGDLPMSYQELSALARSPLVEIGAHTRYHPVLTELSKEKQLEEIQGSKLELEKILKMPVRSFSYPHGKCSDATVGLIKTSGFDCAFTVDHSPVKRTSNVYRLPRFTVLNWDGHEFENRIKTWLR